MSLRFFADHCVPKYVISALESAGHEVLRPRDYLPTDAPDPTVISKAQELRCLLTSLNGDFANIIMFPPSEFMGIIALQLEDHPDILTDLMNRLNNYLIAHPEGQRYEGILLVVSVDAIRIRM